VAENSDQLDHLLEKIKIPFPEEIKKSLPKRDRSSFMFFAKTILFQTKHNQSLFRRD
jgi:hypothetical protein